MSSQKEEERERSVVILEQPDFRPNYISKKEEKKDVAVRGQSIFEESIKPPENKKKAVKSESGQSDNSRQNDPPINLDFLDNEDLRAINSLKSGSGKTPGCLQGSNSINHSSSSISNRLKSLKLEKNGTAISVFGSIKNEDRINI